MSTNLTSGPYGRDEIKKSQQKFLLLGLIVSLAIHLGLLGGYHWNRWIHQKEEAKTVTVRIIKYADLGPPPSLSETLPISSVGVSGASVRASIGTPVPVPDAQVSPEQTIATQRELSAMPGPISGDNAGGGVTTQITQDLNVQEEDPDMNAYVPVEKAPEIVREVKPQYPETARRAGIQAVVWVKVLVGKDGHPKRAVVVKENANGIFDQAATEAAMNYLFTPGVTTVGPIQVWTVLRFRFQLGGATP